MTTTSHRLTRAELEQQVSRLFAPARSSSSRDEPGCIGLEVELIPVYVRGYPPVPVSALSLAEVLSSDEDLARAACLSFEPGGQVELSPPPGATARAALETIRELTDRLHQCVAPHGVLLLSTGVNPWSSCDDLGLQTDRPRYRAMQSHFDAIGAAGRRMIRQTASLQVCLDFGSGEAARERWELVNRAGPALTAAFANSPVLEGTPTGWCSARSAIWQDVDPSRTGFDGAQVGEVDPVDAYLEFALLAEAIPLTRRESESAPPFRLPFGEWLARGDARPDADDLAHHLTTLFPPVRPHGYLEVRYIDALPGRWRALPVCLLAVLVYDPEARRAALSALSTPVRPVTEQWRSAAALGMRDEFLRQHACDLFDIALAGMRRLPAGYLPHDASSLVEEYRERYPASGSCPADDLVDRFAACPQDLSVYL
ncbi:MAG: glutamate-cysteine ligase family protein [Chloroflexota bacterium]|nr:glutamate-cysteine ligase family protein [Chloroflexota bacterium]